MKFIKKTLSCLISAVILCCSASAVPVSAEQQYVYNDHPTVFDLINIRRSLMNSDGEYTISDYNTMLNFLLKKKNTVLSKKVTVSYDTEGCDTSAYADTDIFGPFECTAGTTLRVAASGLKKDGYFHSGWIYAVSYTHLCSIIACASLRLRVGKVPVSTKVFPSNLPSPEVAADL